METAQNMVGVACIGAQPMIASTSAADAKSGRHKICKIVRDRGHPKRVFHWT